jgi:hypothetical protein
VTRTRLYTCLLPLLGLGVGGAASAQSTTPYTQGDNAGVGLLQTPTARMDEAGEFSFVANRALPYTRYGFSMQPFAWLEGTFRYTDIANRPYGSPSLSGNQSYKDKSIDLKLRLHGESRWWPALAVGVRDIGGTGLFSGEYVVASKRFDTFDISLGLGWGYVGGRGDIGNPLGWIDDRFKHRPKPDNTAVGDFNSKTYFRGPVALFGGVEYQTPWAPLRLKLEYDGNDYQHEPKDNNQKQDSPFNFGVVYRVNGGLDLTLGIERGNTAMFGFTLHGTPGQSRRSPKPLDPPPEPRAPHAARKVPERVDWPQVSQRLRDNAGIQVSQVARRGNEVFVTGEQQRFYYPAEGIGRAARILDNTLAPDIDWFTVVSTQQGMPVVQTSVHRPRFEQLLDHDLSLADFRRSVEQDAPDDNAREVLYRAPPDKYQGGGGLGFQQSVGGPDAFVLYQLNAHYSGEYHFTPHVWLSGGASVNLLNNYDHFKYDAPSNLPRVRTYVREYLTTSRLNLDHLQLSAAGRLRRDLYGMVYGGLLESMYGGVGGELLYRPFGEHWAIGGDVNWVRQRGFAQHFGFRDYDVVTGHLTAYVDTGIQDVLAKVSYGRYLAGDIGTTIDLSRVFGNGVRMGAWATFTNVSRAQFGEGSFDKGIYISIPFDLTLPRSTTTVTRVVWQPLLRDGGAKLNRQYSLYDLTDGRDPRLFDANFDTLTQ